MYQNNMFWTAKLTKQCSAGQRVISSRTLLTYVPLRKQTSPVTLSPRAHNFPHPSSCIIASCLLVAAGASQWPRYNESLWLLLLLPALAACILWLHHQPQVFSLCHHCVTHISIVTSPKWLQGMRLHVEGFSSLDSWLCEEVGWEWVQNEARADNSWGLGWLLSPTLPSSG